MNSINLARTFNKTADGLYPKLKLRGEEMIKQALEFGLDEHEIWLDWLALMQESILNTNFDTRSMFLRTIENLRGK